MNAHHPATIEMPARFEGYPGLMQGGYVAGAAVPFEQASGWRVQIRRPVHPGDQLTVSLDEPDRRELVDAEGRLALRSFRDDLAVAEPDPRDEASTAVALAEPLPWPKPFPSCAGCGDRGDGLGVDLHVAVGSGPGARSEIVGTWTPTEGAGGGSARCGDRPAQADHRHVWTVVDCLTSWSLFVDPPTDPSGAFVTGNIALRFLRPLQVGVTYHLRSWRERDLPPGRSHFRLGSVIVGGTITDPAAPDGEQLIAVTDQELVRTEGSGMTLDPAGGPGPVL